MLALRLLLQVLHLDQGQELFLQASSNCLQATGETVSQNLQDQQPTESLLVAFAPWLCVGSPFGQGSQRKLWFVVNTMIKFSSS